MINFQIYKNGQQIEFEKKNNAFLMIKIFKHYLFFMAFMEEVKIGKHFLKN